MQAEGGGEGRGAAGRRVARFSLCARGLVCVLLLLEEGVGDDAPGGVARARGGQDRFGGVEAAVGLGARGVGVGGVFVQNKAE